MNARTICLHCRKPFLGSRCERCGSERERRAYNRDFCEHCKEAIDPRKRAAFDPRSGKTYHVWCWAQTGKFVR